MNNLCQMYFLNKSETKSIKKDPNYVNLQKAKEKKSFLFIDIDGYQQHLTFQYEDLLTLRRKYWRHETNLFHSCFSLLCTLTVHEKFKIVQYESISQLSQENLLNFDNQATLVVRCGAASSYRHLLCSKCSGKISYIHPPIQCAHSTCVKLAQRAMG